MGLTRVSSFLVLFLTMFVLGMVSGLAAIASLSSQTLPMEFSFSRVQTFLNAAGTYWLAASFVGAIAIATEALVDHRIPFEPFDEDALDDDDSNEGDGHSDD